MFKTKSVCVPGRNLSFHETNKYSFSANVREIEHKEKLPHLSMGNKIFQVFLLSDFAFSVSLLRLRLPSLKKMQGESELQAEALTVAVQHSLLCPHLPAASEEASPPLPASSLNHHSRIVPRTPSG